jgi:hypothetical protein
MVELRLMANATCFGGTGGAFSVPDARAIAEQFPALPSILAIWILSERCGKFEDTVTEAKVAVIYYAGHGSRFMALIISSRSTPSLRAVAMPMMKPLTRRSVDLDVSVCVGQRPVVNNARVSP